jgi:hypothetical protein
MFKWPIFFCFHDNEDFQFIYETCFIAAYTSTSASFITCIFQYGLWVIFRVS